MPHSDGAYTAVLHARRHLKAIWPEPWAKNNKGLEQLVLMVARRVVREASLEEKTAMEERLPAWMTKDTLEQWMVLRQAPEKAAPATPVASPAPLVDSPSPAAEGTPEKVVQFGKLRRIALAKYVCLNRQRLKGLVGEKFPDAKGWKRRDGYLKRLGAEEFRKLGVEEQRHLLYQAAGDALPVGALAAEVVPKAKLPKTKAAAVGRQLLRLANDKAVHGQTLTVQMLFAMCLAGAGIPYKKGRKIVGKLAKQNYTDKIPVKKVTKQRGRPKGSRVMAHTEGQRMRAAATNRRSSGWRPTKGRGHGKGRVSVASGRASTS